MVGVDTVVVVSGWIVDAIWLRGMLVEGQPPLASDMVVPGEQPGIGAQMRQPWTGQIDQSQRTRLVDQAK